LQRIEISGTSLLSVLLIFLKALFNLQYNDHVAYRDSKRSHNKMNLRYLVLAISTTFLTACGGGGGSGSTPAPSVPPPGGSGSTPAPTVPPPYTLSAVNAKYVAGYPATVNLTATQTTPFVGIAYLKLTSDNDVIQSMQAKPNTDGSFAITLNPSGTAMAGHYAGQITVNVCKDAACTSSFDGAPFKVPYVIDIVPAEGGTVPSNLTALAPIAGVGDWSGFQGNAAHTGFVPVALAPAKFTLRWKYEAASVNGYQMMISDIVTSAGQFYFSTGGFWDASNVGHNLYAFNEQDGKQSWIHDFGNLKTPTTNPPGVANGKVYLFAGSQESTAMFAFDAKNGTQLFSTPGASQWEHYLAPVVVGGSVYSEGGAYGGMFAYNAGTGAMQWFTNLAQIDGWTPAVDADNAYVYLNNALEIVDRRTGTRVRQIPGTANAWTTGATPLIGAPGNIIVTGNEALTNFDTVNGQVRWTVPGHFHAGSAYDNKEIFVLNGGPYVLEARSETDGSTLWSWTPPAPTGGWRGNVLLTQNQVFVSTDNATYAIDRTSHATVWTQPFPGKLTLSATGVLYINNDTSVLAINVK
jgi:hypothetical protein